MRKLKLLILLVAIITFQSCKKKSSGSESSSEVTTYEEETVDSLDTVEEAYPDGTYCADIDYYNPNTGTRSTYTLNVEVESNEVTVIQWPNGGWLDSTHFSPEELDSGGSCSFTAYDGKQYDVQITGQECSFTDNTKVKDDEDAVTCPECGGIKSEYDDICDDCKRAIEEKNQKLEEEQNQTDDDN